MPEESNHLYPFDRPGYYQIRILDKPRKSWLEYLNGFTIKSTSWGCYPQVTLISGWLSDQTALSGLLYLLNDLGSVILTVERLEMDEETH